MATSSHKARLIVGGYETSAVTSSATVSTSTEMLDSTCLADAAKRSTAGLADATFTCEGFTDATAGTAYQFFFDFVEVLGAAPVATTYAPQGTGVGSPAIVVGLRRTNWEQTSPVNGLNGFSFSGQVDGPAGIGGVMLHDNTAETADGNGTSWDRGITSSAAGAVACLHTTAFSGFSTNVVVIEDSANNSAFSTIGTFTTQSSANSASFISIAGTVRRYVRARWDVTGTGTTSFAVSFAPL